MAAQMTPDHVTIATKMLGLPDDSGISERNFITVGCYSNPGLWADLFEMADAGYAVMVDDWDEDDEDVATFRLTREAALAAMLPGETIVAGVAFGEAC
jgi:hypothetical protein